MCYPATWEPQIEMVELKPVPPGSNEWKSIIDRIHKTLPSAEVRMLQRIQDQWLWEKYSSSKARKEEAKGKTNEKDLFHGTRSIPRTKYIDLNMVLIFAFLVKECGVQVPILQ